jgi:hypothetical protein
MVLRQVFPAFGIDVGPQPTFDADEQVPQPKSGSLNPQCQQLDSLDWTKICQYRRHCWLSLGPAADD